VDTMKRETVGSTQSSGGFLCGPNKCNKNVALPMEVDRQLKQECVGLIGKGCGALCEPRKR
jgi:hypothetical protein